MKKIVFTMALAVVSLATFAKDNFKMTLLNAYLGETDVFFYQYLDDTLKQYGVSMVWSFAVSGNRKCRRYVNYCMNWNGESGKKCIFAA